MCVSRRFGYCLLLMPRFTLDVEKTARSADDVTVYQLKGKLSLETVAGFIPQMRQESARRVILDMSGVNFLDSAGVGALVSLFVSRRNQGKTFALAALTPQATAVVTVAGLQKLLPVFKTVEEASAGGS
jgi:anti-sigma B factor antagonist